jgi:hypothetical protein
MGSNDGSLSGYVKDSKSKETLIGARVSIKDTKRGAMTNKSGFYSIPNIQSGEYVVIVKYIGYNDYEEKIKISKGEKIRKDIVLAPLDIKTKDVTVTADKEVEKREISISRVNIPIQQIKEIRIGGEPDLFRALQMLPGVLTSSQISSGLYVRGGSPDQNLVLLDGATVYNPSHMFGFISTFNTDAIKDVDMIKGGFPAQYGGRLSAILNITQKEGNQEEYKGAAAIGVISSRLSLEGPIPNGTAIVSARSTYFNLIKKAVEDKENPLPDFSFYDINAKITQNLGASNKLYISGFASNDDFGMNDDGFGVDLSIDNKLGALRWTSIWDDNLFSNLSLSWSKYENKMTFDNAGYNSLMNNSIEDLTAKFNLEWFIDDAITANVGWESNKYRFTYVQSFGGASSDAGKGSSKPGAMNLDVKDWNHAAYANLNFQLTDLFSIQAGARTYYWDLMDKFLVDPRIAVKYRIDENQAIKFSWGLYHQNLRLSAMPDFSFFDTWLPSDTTVPASKAIHYILSYETKLWDDFDFTFDTYYKVLSDVSEMNTTARSGSVTRDAFYIGNSQSYGAELFIQKKVGRLTGWFGYALGFVESKFDDLNEGKMFRPKYDRRHDVKIAGQYALSENWDMGATFTFQSGQSYTGATSRFQSTMPGENYGQGKIFTSKLYGLRLPASHQLNVNFSYKFKSFGSLASRLNIDIYNVYSHRDILMRFYDTQDDKAKLKDVKLLPIIPTISYEINF